MFSNWLINQAGYENAMLIKHIFIFVTGLCSGALGMFVISMKIVNNYTKREDIPHVAVLKIKQNGKSYYFANPKNFFEASYVFFFCFFLNDKKPHIRKEDIANKIKVFSTMFIIILVMSLLLGVFASLGIVEHP